MKKKEAIFFVYGTLKHGHGNHGCLGKNPEFLGEYATEPRYTLFDGGFPIVERQGVTSIKGELYKVTNAEDVAAVFGLESCVSQKQGDPNNWYDFDEINTETGTAIMFVMSKGKARRNKILENGIWK